MAREPLPVGTWGSITTRVASRDEKGQARKFEARAYFRDLDGQTRPVAKWGDTADQAKNRLREALKSRQRIGGVGQLKSSDRVSTAAELFLAEVEDLVVQDVLAPGTHETYTYQYDKNLAPRIGGLRLFEANTPRVSDVIKGIRDEVGSATAKTCKSILTGTFALAVRHGALTSNPVREIKIRATSRKRLPRALESDEREQWFDLLRQDEHAAKADLIDLSKFMIATGERIGECLAVTWRDLNRDTGEIDCSHQIQRIKGKGLIRRRVKSSAGDRIIGLPTWALEMLLARRTPGASQDAPIFPDSKGGFRDPHNVQKALRNARRPVGGQRRQQLGSVLRTHRRNAGMTQDQVIAKLGWRKTRISLIETGRVRLTAEEAVTLAETYRLTKTDRAALLELTELAGMRSLADELEWVTAHVFRKTTATILESAGQTPRQVADQLGHAQTSTTVDDYFGRRRRNPEAAQHLEAAMRHIHEQDRDSSAEPDI
ncbi:helix-turn-helix domain-containing protein [Kribbella sp. NPDC026611]|uniref:helix-turn-helix domain-containing protein n=1 Tax=Kribbella sp. NPDC026611 TaxID=3154911 RepID=UPI0033E8CDE8